MLNRTKYLYTNRIVILFITIVDSILSIFFTKKRKRPEVIQKILIVKPDHLGDVLLLTAILKLIAVRFPEVKIDIVCSSWAIEILKYNKYINHMYIVDHMLLSRNNITPFHKVLIFIKSFVITLLRLREQKYDLCLAMRAGMGNLLSLCKLSGSKCVIGFSTSGLGVLCDISPNWISGKHEVEHFLEILKPLGIECADFRILKSEINYTENEHQVIDELLRAYELKPQEFIVIHPGAGSVKRQLPIKLWQKLLQKNNLNVVICGAKSERGFVEKLMKNFKVDFRVVSLIERLTIRQLALLFSQAKKLFVLDSLSVHIAAMTNVETIAFYYGLPTKKSTWEAHITQWRPINDNIKIVTAPECEKYINEINVIG